MIYQDCDKIIVTELRPMSDHPKIPSGQLQVFVLVFLDFTSLPILISFDEREQWHDQAYHGIGWIPAPIYQPESKTQDKASLYEKIRKLNPREFAELHERNLRGEGSFDDLVSRLP